jgi:hypothetical protein
MRIGRAWTALAQDPRAAFAGMGPGIGAMAGQAVGFAGSTVGRILEMGGEIPMVGGLLAGGGAAMRRMAEALGPAAEAIITASFQQTQAVYDAFARFEQTQMAVSPFFTGARQWGTEAELRMAGQLGFGGTEALGILGQVARGAGFDPFRGGGIWDRPVQRRADPAQLLLHRIRMGLDPEVASRMLALARPGGVFGTRRPEMFGVSPAQPGFGFIDLFGGIGERAGYDPQLLNAMMTQFAAILEEMGRRGIDVDPEALGGLMETFTGRAGLEGERLTGFVGRMFGGMGRVAGGQGDPLQQYIMLGAAMQAGARDYPEMIRMLETGDPETFRYVLERLQSLGPRAPLVMQRLGLAGSYQQAERILSGEMGIGRAGMGFEGRGVFAAETKVLQAQIEAQRIVLGEEVVPIARDLTTALQTMEVASLATTEAFGTLAGDVLPKLTGLLRDLTVEGFDFLGLITGERAEQLMRIQD